MIVNLDCQKSIDRINYCLKHAKGSIIVCEINEHPLVWDVFENLHADIDKVEVTNNSNYREIIQSSQKDSIFLYNFNKISNDIKALSNNINFSRDLFLRAEKNFIFVLPTFVVLSLMKDNISFWSCVSVYERFVGSKSCIFDYTMYMELTERSRSIQGVTVFFKSSVCRNPYCEKKECDFRPDGCMAKKLATVKNKRTYYLLYHSCLRLYRQQLFNSSIDCGNLILSNTTKEDPLYFKTKLLIAADYYHLGHFDDAINIYNEIIQESTDNDFYDFFYSAVLNKCIICIKHNSIVSHTSEKDLFDLQEKIEKAFESNYHNKEHVNDTNLKRIYYLASYDTALFLLKKSKFQDAISVLDHAMMIDTLKYSYEKTNLKILKVFIFIRLGSTNDAVRLIENLKLEINSFLSEDKLWWLRLNFDYCRAFLSFTQGKYSDVFKIEKKTSQKIASLNKNGYLGTLPYRFHFEYLKAMSLFYFSDKRDAYEAFKKTLKISPCSEDYNNVKRIIQYVLEYI